MLRRARHRCCVHAAASLWLAGCALSPIDASLPPVSPVRSAPAPIPPSAAVPAERAPSTASPLLGENHAFALYNENGHLVHSPVEHLLRELARREGQRPITDVFIMSHGWNFTLEESALLWENYRLSFERAVAAFREADPDFEPFLIFVAWSSVSRPLSTSLASLSPFELPSAVSSVTELLDGVLFHVPSNWGETQDAYSMALGPRERRFFDTTQSHVESQYDQAVQREIQATLFRPTRGYDVPVSVLLDELIRTKFRQPESRRFRLHAVGHSFGAKVLSLGAFDAVARLVLSAKETGAITLCDRAESETGRPPACAAYLDSLVLLNGALKPQEMYNPIMVRGPRVASLPASFEAVEKGIAGAQAVYEEVTGRDEDFREFALLARSIPRKAVVFSDADSATGWLFGVSQILLDYEAVARMQDAAPRTYFKLQPRFVDTRAGPVWAAATWPVNQLSRQISQVYGYTAIFATSIVETYSNHALALAQEPIYIFRRIPDDPRAAFRLLSFPVAPLRAQLAMGNRGLKDVEDSSSFFNSWLGLRVSRNPKAMANRAFLDDSIDCSRESFFALSSGEASARLPEDDRFFTFDAGLVYTGMPDHPSLLRRAYSPVVFPPGAHGDVRGYEKIGDLAKRERTLRFLFGFTHDDRMPDSDLCKP